VVPLLYVSRLIFSPRQLLKGSGFGDLSTRYTQVLWNCVAVSCRTTFLVPVVISTLVWPGRNGYGLRLPPLDTSLGGPWFAGTEEGAPPASGTLLVDFDPYLFFVLGRLSAKQLCSRSWPPFLTSATMVFSLRVTTSQAPLV